MLSGYVLSLLVNFFPVPSQAQITLDGTFGPKGSLRGPDYTIDAKLGRQVGSNLFHSFGDFNVHTGESATFTGPATVENVIGRVTGGQVSDIDGTLRSEMPKANLYLLNPAGVMFGPHATLDVPGSFHVSTADYIKLGDRGRFAATRPENSVLTSAPPAAFGFLGPNPASIAIQGSTLQVAEGKTLSVIGGNLTLEGSTLTAPKGQINLASVASAGDVEPSLGNQPPDLQMESFSLLGNMRLNSTSIDTSGEGGGTIFIRGGQLITDQASVQAVTQGAVDGRGINIATTDLLSMSHSVITAKTEGAGRSGNIDINSKSLMLTGDSKISVGSSGKGMV